MPPFLRRKKDALLKRVWFFLALLLACHLLSGASLFAAEQISSFPVEEVRPNSPVKTFELTRKLTELRKQEKKAEESIQKLKGMLPKSEFQEIQLGAGEQTLRQQLEAAQKSLKPLQGQQAAMQAEIHQIEIQANDLVTQARSVNSEAGAQTLLNNARNLYNRAMQLANSSQAKNLEAQIIGIQNHARTLSGQLGQTSAQYRGTDVRSRQLALRLQQETARLASIRREIAKIEKQLGVGNPQTTALKKAPLSWYELERQLLKNPDAKKAYEALSTQEREFDALIDREKFRPFEFDDHRINFTKAVEKMHHEMALTGANSVAGLFAEWLTLHEARKPDDLLMVGTHSGEKEYNALKISDMPEFFKGVIPESYVKYLPEVIPWPDFKVIAKAATVVVPKLERLARHGPMLVGADIVFETAMVYKHSRREIFNLGIQTEGDLIYQSLHREKIKGKLTTVQESRKQLADQLSVSVDQIPKRVSQWQMENHLTPPPAKNSPRNFSPSPNSEDEWLNNFAVADLQGASAERRTVPLLGRTKK